jgi:hypothetical protein
MTNEEIIEEIFYKASTMGLFNELHEMVSNNRTVDSKKTYVESVEQSFNELLKQKQLQL